MQFEIRQALTFKNKRNLKLTECFNSYTEVGEVEEVKEVDDIDVEEGIVSN